MVPIDPDAPWGWNLVIILVVLAVVPAFSSWLTTRGTKHKLNAMADDISASRGQVENEHLGSAFPNLRDEITAIRDGVAAVRDDVGGIHSEIRDVRQDIAGVRTDARHDRRDIAASQRAFDEHLAAVPALLAETVAKAEAAHARTCPPKETP